MERDNQMVQKTFDNTWVACEFFGLMSIAVVAHVTPKKMKATRAALEDPVQALRTE